MGKASRGKASRRYQYSLRGEPAGSDYVQLVRWAVARSDSVTMVTCFEPHARPEDVLVGPLAPLSSQRISHRATREWPGTRTRGPGSTLFRFRSSQATADVMATAVERLFEWQQLGALEDPAFWRGDVCWMHTTSHESHAHITATEDEMLRMQTELPLLGSLIGRRVRLPG